MKTPALAVLALAGLALSPARAGAADLPAGERFAWLAGCWSGEKDATRFREHWMVAAPGLLLAAGATTAPGKPVEFEFLRIEDRPAGPAYVAQPGGAPPTAFTLSAADSTPDTAMFVNMQHDFPKRIAYRRVDAESLLAWIDAGPKGALKVEFPMRRTACPGARP